MTAPDPIRLTGVTHRYGEVSALEIEALTIPPACLAGIIGPDGVGKSTLLGLITGARKVQAGTVEVLGGDIARPRHRRRVAARIAYMPQGLGRNLYPDLTVAENLDFFGRLHGQEAALRARRIGALLAATGLGPFPDRPAGNLSGGMKQKLGLCCALIHEPDLMVLDEPTTGVDPLSRRQFWDLIGAIRARRPGLGVVVSTAYMEEAAAFDWLMAVDAGRAIATGTPQEIMQAAGADGLEDAYRALRPGRRARAPLTIPARDGADGAPVIAARGLTRRFGDFTAVDGVSFEIGRGEIFGFLGSNGCGKSTTMKMLTGLLPASAGEARLFGRPVRAGDREARREIGYMSQAFSLYGELTVAQNLDLHARLFALGPAHRRARIAALSDRFGLAPYRDALAEGLPLGVRQRLSLAVAVIHEPKLLILDEPTSGVDPEARDDFWALIVELSREQGVTIFVSTHFMAEAMRCDRVSLMHAGRVLACDSPRALIAAAGAETLEDAFVARLRAAGAAGEGAGADTALPADATPAPPRNPWFSAGRFAAYARRETLEVIRDPVRLIFSFFGTGLLMIVFCFGISLDIEDLTFAVHDLDRTPESRAYAAAYAGSRYFERRPDLLGPADGRARLQRGEIALMLEIPPGFGKALKTGGRTEILAMVDGAIPFKGETVEGYVAGIHRSHLERRARARTGHPLPAAPARIETRFRYNESFESINAMAPSMSALLLILLPAIITAVSVARERELGSITNFYVTPTTRLEFLMGKQAPYLAMAALNFLVLAAMTVTIFGVPLRGNAAALGLGALLYVWATTSFGLVVATMTRSQVAAVFATALLSIIPTIQFSGLLQPVSTLEGGARVFGALWPASHFLHLSVGAFTKGLGWAGLAPDLLALAVFGPAFTAIAALGLRAQAR